MKYTEEYGNLFDVDDSYYLCHCISADFQLGKGIAVEFNNRYNMKQQLNFKYVVFGDYPVALLVDNVFNLVTKDRYWNKPTYETLKSALLDMRRQMIEKGIKKIAMPQIGAGLDRLAWFRVSEIIKDIFKDDDVEIRVIIYNGKT